MVMTAGEEVIETGRGRRGPGAVWRGIIERGSVPKGFELRFFMGASQAKVSSHETQAQDSRDEILKAAIHLFASRGFHETSMSEVAREAKVSKALIFWHFKTKEELFLAVLNRLLEPYFIDFAEEAAALDERAQIAQAGAVIPALRARQRRLGALLSGPTTARREGPRCTGDAGDETVRRLSRN